MLSGAGHDWLKATLPGELTDGRDVRWRSVDTVFVECSVNGSDFTPAGSLAVLADDISISGLNVANGSKNGGTTLIISGSGIPRVCTCRFVSVGLPSISLVLLPFSFPFPSLLASSLSSLRWILMAHGAGLGAGHSRCGSLPGSARTRKARRLLYWKQHS